MKISLMLGTVAAFVLCCSGIYGQSEVSGTLGPDAANRKIVTIPQLQPPKEVLESGLGGNVRVKVLVDDAGNVTSVDDVVGPGAVCRRVTRADVTAMRSSAKEAAMTAKFEPASQPAATFSTWLNFAFPGGEEESDFVAAMAEPVQDGARYTIMPDPNHGASDAPPPHYRGPVNTGSAAAKSGSTDAANLPKMISGGVLNGKAFELPKPSYPAAARAVRASGAVSVQVLIDEKGEVFLAKAVSGHPLLRSASTIAACESRFAPTRLAGNPVKVSGIITYNFVP